MLTSSLHTNWVVRIFVLVYLLLITSTANAFFWCQSADASSHLEANLSGSCWIPCPTESNQGQAAALPADARAAFSSAEGDCFDSPALASLIAPPKQSHPKPKITVIDSETAASSVVQTCGLTAAGLNTPPLAHNLPPRQAFSALQTIVLRQ